MARNADMEFRIDANVTGIPAIQAVQNKLRGLEGQMTRSQRAVNQYGGSVSDAQRRTRRFAMGALQQAGFQIGDYAVQVANGTSKMQAFGQQGSQLLGIFGPFGAVLGAGVAIFSAFSIAASRSGASVGELGAALGVLQEPFAAVAGAVKSMAGNFSGAMQIMLQNIDTALITAGLFATYMAGKYVASIAIATASTITFEGAMYAMGVAVARVQMILARFLPAAIIIGLGYLIERFLTLRKAVGGFGEAFNMVWEVVKEFGNNVNIYINYIITRLGAWFAQFKADTIGVFAAIAEWIQGTWISNLLGSAAGAVKAYAAAWEFIKEFIPNVFREALRGALQFVDDGLNALVGKLDDLLQRVGIDKFADFQSSLANTFVGEAAQIEPLIDRINRAFVEGQEAGAAFVGNLSTSLSDRAAELNEVARIMQKNADMFLGYISTEKWDALKAAIASATSEINLFGGAAGDAGKAAADSVKKIEDRFQSLKDSIRSSMENAFMSMVDGTKTVPQAFKAMATEIIKELYRVLVVQRLVAQISSFLGMNQVSGPWFGPGSGANYAPPSRPIGLGAKAMGGPITAGRPYMVGERGPELIVPSRNASVIPNDQLSGGGVTVIQNNTFGNGVSRADIQAMLPRIVETTKAAVFDAQRRSVTGRGYA